MLTCKFADKSFDLLLHTSNYTAAVLTASITTELQNSFSIGNDILVRVKNYNATEMSRNTYEPNVS